MRCDKAAAFSDVAGQITRTFCSPATAALHAQLRHWMEQSGMSCRLDAAGNLIGRWEPAGSANAPALLVGSHLDTVANAGRFDGVLGVMLALSLVEAVAASATPLPFAIEVIGFSEEEGLRYGRPFIGSKALVGQCDEELLASVDANGISVRTALASFGCSAAITTAEIDATRVVAYL
jgi:allantoate deiminase